MRELFTSVFYASALFGVASQLLHSRMRGGMRLCFGAMLLSVIISTLPKDIELDFSIDDVAVGDGEGEYYYVTKEALERGVAEYLSEKMGFERESVDVSLIDFDIENMRAECVRVTLRGASALGDLRRAEALVEDIGIGRCVVDVQIG